MKTAKRALLLLSLTAFAFLVYRAFHPAQFSGLIQTNTAQCDQSLWNYVYHPQRLQVLQPCITVTGTIDEIRKEADGDYHVQFDFQDVRLIPWCVVFCLRCR